MEKVRCGKTRLYSVIIVETLLVTSLFGFFIEISPNEITTSPHTYDVGEEECAGLVATGTCVKDGRSIFWKSRHSGTSNNKPDWQSGTNYNYWSVSGYLGMNEVGLAMGNLVCYDLIDVENRDYSHTEIQGDGVNGLSTAIHRALGRYDTVGEAARFMAINCTYSGNYQVGIVSSEPGVGAVVSMMKYGDTTYAHITWVNNTWAALANAHYCDGDLDPNDNNDETIYDMCTDITTNGGINGDYKIDWQEICQRGGKNVSGKEKGTDTFSCTGEIAKGSASVAMVAVSGNSSYDGAANVAFTAFGRQPLVGIFLPLGASYLTSDADIPSNFTSGGGIEDYVDVKSIYATTTGVVHGNEFFCDRVREILEYANYNENISFDAYDSFMDNLMTVADTAEVKARLEIFADENMSLTLSGYENCAGPSENTAPVVSDIPDQTIAEGASFTTINLDDYVTDSEDPDSAISWSYSGDSELTIDITNRIATITTPNENWNGEETITFTATGTGGLTDSDAATFNVTAVNDPPNTPSNPNPADSTTSVSITVDLSWIGGDIDGDPVTYDVYFGTTSPPSKIVSNQSGTTYDPGTLDYKTTYYWKIIAWDNHDSSASGSIWEFETVEDTTDPEISNITTTTSSPLDTSSSYGWINITCTVTDNVAVDEVYLNITNPDGSYTNVSMNAGAGNTYYYNSSTTFSTYGNYSYFIWANDTINNVAISSNNDFSMSPNWDIDKDGDCDVFDYVLVSNHYGKTGAPRWIREDVDNNGEIQVMDLVLVSGHYGESWWV